MGWMTRLGLFAFGLFLIVASVAQMRAGKFVFDNASYHQQTFAAGGIGLGVVFLLLAFLPPREWVYKHITTKRRAVGRSKKSR